MVDYGRLGNYGGPSQVGLSPDGSKVAVTTWGVPQFGASGNTVGSSIQEPSRVYFYDVVSTSTVLTLIPAGIFEKVGVSGSIGFSWSSDNNRVYVANFNLANTGTTTLTNV